MPHFSFQGEVWLFAHVVTCSRQAQTQQNGKPSYYQAKQIPQGQAVQEIAMVPSGAVPGSSAPLDPSKILSLSGSPCFTSFGFWVTFLWMVCLWQWARNPEVGKRVGMGYRYTWPWFLGSVRKDLGWMECALILQAASDSAGHSSCKNLCLCSTTCNSVSQMFQKASALLWLRVKKVPGNLHLEHTLQAILILEQLGKKHWIPSFWQVSGVHTIEFIP